MAGLSALAKIIAKQHAGKALPKAVHTRRSIPSGSAMVDKDVPIDQIHMSESDIVDVGPLLDKAKALAALKNIDEGEAFFKVLQESVSSSPVAKTPKKYDPPLRIQLAKELDEKKSKKKQPPILNKSILHDLQFPPISDLENLPKRKKRISILQEREQLEAIDTPTIRKEVVKKRNPESYITGSPSIELEKSGFPEYSGILNLRYQAQKLLDETLTKGEAKRIIGESDGLPTILFHATHSKKPFPEFKVLDRERYPNEKPVSRYPFLSTSTDPEVIRMFGLHSGLERTENLEKYKALLEKVHMNMTPIIKEGKRKGQISGTQAFNASLKRLIRLGSIGPDDARSLQEFGKRAEGARTILGVGKVKKLFDYNKLEDQQALIKLFKDENWPTVISSSGRESAHYNKLPKEEKEFIIKRIQRGSYAQLEDTPILKALDKLGYDAFTTGEGGAKNIMLMKPDEQFIPIFDPRKQSTIGYNIGGSIKTNPYLRGLV